MKNINNFSIFPLLIMGVFLVFASSCEKDDDINEQQNVPLLSTTEITEITANTATSGGNITDNGGAKVTARGVCWSTGQTPTLTDNKTEDGTGVSSFTSSVTNLESNTTYYLRAYATNSAGTAYGSAMSFTTQWGSNGSAFTDPRDGKVYHTVVLGNQEWMAENLAYAPPSGNYWAYDNDDANVEIYGYLYDWETAQDVCPTGWHLPSDEEWKELEMILGMTLEEADREGCWRSTYYEGSSLAGNAGLWNDGFLNEDPFFGQSGFTALPGGYHIGGNFGGVRESGGWWTATKTAGFLTDWLFFYRKLHYNHYDVFRTSGSDYAGLSVRCLRD